MVEKTSPRAEPERLLVVAADLLAVRAIGPWLSNALDDLARGVGDALPASDIGAELELALHELAVNIVTHGYGGGDSDQNSDKNEIGLSWRVDIAERPVVTIVVRDSAPAYVPRPDRRSELGTATIHGFGLTLIEQLVDRFSHERVGTENVWTMVRRV